MAQYYQVLSQDDKSAEELRQYYPNLVENQTVQYVINPETQQPKFQGQQILLSEQLMVIDNRNQHVIVDQSGAYQSSQYVLQDGTVEYQDTRTPQIYYMEEVDAEPPVQIEQSGQPVVLNNQLQQPASIQEQLTDVQKTVMPLQVRQTQMQQQNRQIQSSVRQILQQTRTVTVQQDHPQIVHRAPIEQQLRQPQMQQPHIQQHQTSLAVHQKMPNRSVQANLRMGTTTGNHNVPSLHYTQPKLKQNEITENESHEAVALTDGRVVSMLDYKQMLAEKQRTNANVQAQERGENSLIKYGNCLTAKPKSGRNSNPNRAPRRRFTARLSDNDTYSIHENAECVKQQPFITPPQLKQPLNQQQKQQCLPQNQYLQKQRQHQQMVANQQHHHQQLQHQQQQHQHHHQCQQQQQNQQPQSHPAPQTPQYIIQPPSQLQQHSHGPLPSYIASSQIQQIIENTPLSEEYSDSIRMLVLLESGEQRLITFTLPKEACTIQEILEQVGVPFSSDTKIEITETSHAGINYVVTVGSPSSDTFQHSQEVIESEKVNSQPTTQKAIDPAPPLVEPVPPARSPSPEPPIEIEAPRYVPGLLAVCNHCGYTSENLNRCLRCRFKLPEDVRTISVAALNNDKKKSENSKIAQSLDKRNSICKTPLSMKLSNGPLKRKKSKMFELEPVVLTLSSDEEEESPANQLSETDQLIRRLSNSSVTLSAIKKEPSESDIQQNFGHEVAVGVKGGGKDDFADMPNLTIKIECRTIRIGSYKYIPTENIILNSKEIILKVPIPESNNFTVIVIEKKHIVKVLASFHKVLPVFFYYIMPVAANHVREQLGMQEGDEMYFDPLSKEESYKRITILPEGVDEDLRSVFKHIYGKPINIIEELTPMEANDILVKTCPIEVSKVIANAGYTEVRQLLIYPPGKGGLSINTEDYLCLAQDQFINDVIIDFYLKYLVLNLPSELQERVHVFSTFFYKRLTTKPIKASRRSHPAELDPVLTAAQKRHARVEKWTKSVNLFKKDFIIIPINESCHWFLAIICFPGLNGSVSMEDGRAVTIIPKQKKKKNATTTIGNVTITTVKQEKEEKPIICDEGETSDKDEAEGDESELDSTEDCDEPEPEQIPASKRPRIKQPCILIFDSLAGASRNRVVATLRDYLTCEYKIKMGKERIFNKDVIKGSSPKVPQQNNFTDCGLYLLQYVEQFFEDPITDYHRPIKQIENWFDEMVVTKKREDISNLIKSLMKKYNKDVDVLPTIAFPTLDGQLVMKHPEDDEDELMDEFEEEEELTEETSGDLSNTTNSETNFDTTESDIVAKDFTDEDDKLSFEDNHKASQESAKQCSGFTEQTVNNAASLKPSTSEMQKSSRDTLSYLKAKRINRHKNTDTAVELKKFKPSE